MSVSHRLQFLLKILAVCSSMFAGASNAVACLINHCGSRYPLETYVANAPVIFVGTVTKSDIDNGPIEMLAEHIKVIFHIDFPFRGVSGSTYELDYSLISDCDYIYEFKAGQQWLFAGANSTFEKSILLVDQGKKKYLVPEEKLLLDKIYTHTSLITSQPLPGSCISG